MQLRVFLFCNKQDGPVKNTLVLEIKDENDNIVFKDEKLPLISGNNIEYVWDGFFNQVNKKQSIVTEEYNIFFLYTGAIGGTIKEHIFFHAVKVTPYIDKNYSILLTDWKNDEKVSPRYLFGQNNKIYTHVKGWRSTWPDEMFVETNLGEKLPLKIKIDEIQKKFVAESFLFADTTDVKKLKIKIENEETLIFKVKNPTEIPQEPG